MPPPARPPPPAKKTKAPAPPPPPNAKQKLEKLAASGYVDVNDASRLISDLKTDRPNRALLRELKLLLIQHQSVFDRGAFQKIRAFCETYRAENDVD